jgi:hypothetical protein
MARRQIRRTGENGAGLALAGLIVGYAGVFLAVILVIVAISLVAHFSSQANFGGCPGPRIVTCGKGFG